MRCASTYSARRREDCPNARWDCRAAGARTAHNGDDVPPSFFPRSACDTSSPRAWSKPSALSSTRRDARRAENSPTRGASSCSRSTRPGCQREGLRLPSSAVENEDSSIIAIDSLNGYVNAMPEERFLTLHLHELLSYLTGGGADDSSSEARCTIPGPSAASRNRRA